MYNLNINKSSIVPTNLIVGRVLDKPFDTIQFKIHDGLDVMDLTGCTLEFRGTTPDNKKVTSNAIKVLDAKSGEIEFTFPPNFYSAKGHFQNAYFVIKKDSNSESTNDLLITVLNAVDFNLDDAPIIIDQLDDLIQAVIDDLNNQLSKVKGDIKQTQDNITALKKDVDAYKGQFNTEMTKMQNQLDELKQALDGTDVQIPKITSTSGGAFKVWYDGFNLLDSMKELGRGFHTIRAHTRGSELPVADKVFLMYVNIDDVRVDKTINHATIIAISTLNSNSYTGTINVDKFSGWKQLDGQVPKITLDNGNHFIINDKNKSILDHAKQLGAGIKKVYIINAMGIPEQFIHGLMNISASFSLITFEGTSEVNGNSYSYSYAEGVDKGWKRLDGQVAKITKDDGKSKDVWSGSFDLWEKIRTLGSGFHTVYATNTNNQLPINDARYMMVVQIHEMIESSGYVSYGRITAYNVFDGSTYVQTIRYNDLKGWVRLDNVLPQIATQTQNGLLSSTDKKSLDSLNYTSKVAFTPSSPATLSKLSNLPNVIERNGEFVTFRVALTGVTRGGVVVSTIPTEFRPSSVIFKVCPTNSNKVIRVLIKDDGVVQYGLTPDGIADLTSDDVVYLTFTYKI